MSLINTVICHEVMITKIHASIASLLQVYLTLKLAKIATREGFIKPSSG